MYGKKQGFLARDAGVKSGLRGAGSHLRLWASARQASPTGSG